MWTIPPWKELEQTLRDPSQPIGKRMRAAYYAKTLYVNLTSSSSSEQKEEQKEEKVQDNHINTVVVVHPQTIIDTLCEQVFVIDHGALLRHEFAYVLGQCQSNTALESLHKLLVECVDDDVMVRHEAAEALGAIGSLSSQYVLQTTQQKYKTTLPELSDTCMLAWNRIQKVNNSSDNNDADDNDDMDAVGCACMLAPYSSIDPVTADPKHDTLSTEELGDILLYGPIVTTNTTNTNETQQPNLRDATNLKERYRAMFSLRNRGGETAVLQLCRALIQDTTSALLRHEVAFVLGQLQHPVSIDALEESLSRSSSGRGGEEEEHCMVRHESAEALGAIECTSIDQWKRIESILTKYQQDEDIAVAQSCIVALDAADYFGHSSVDVDEVEAEEKTKVNDNVDNDANDKTNQSSFGKQKHESLLGTENDNSSSCDSKQQQQQQQQQQNEMIRKHILAQHFNVQTTTGPKLAAGM